MFCRHCKSPIPDLTHGAFCCAGCETVYGLIHQAGLDRYYDLTRGPLAPAALASQPGELTWLEPLLSHPATRGQLRLDIQGIQCAACVWLINELYKKMPGGIHLLVNPGIGRLELRFQPETFDVRAFVRRVEAFGYRLGPALKQSRTDDLTLRLGICAAITINVMLFSVSFYFGLSPADGQIFRLFSNLSGVLATLAVGIGGWPFFKSAFHGLKSGVLHLDLPVALGIALVYAMSLLQAAAGDDALYVDTLCTFITLMLLGKWLQRRVVEQNRRWLLEDAGVEGLWCRRIENGALKVVSVSAIKPADELLVSPGELLPVDATLADSRGRISREWLNGESAAQDIGANAGIEAGSFNAGASAIRVVAARAFDSSRLSRLLEKPRASLAADPFWVTLSKKWASRVLIIAGIGFLLWLPKGLQPALAVAAALLVVTCPCAIGLAIPLAYEVVQARLRRVGFFARSDDLLDRLRRVRKVIFDKTGTLTLNRLELERLPELSPEAAEAAYNLSCRSTHPASACIARALAGVGARFNAAFVARELPGDAVTSGNWKLGRRLQGAPGTGLFFKGAEVAVFEFNEALRPSAQAQLKQLDEAGYQRWLLSGDANERVVRLAQRLDFQLAAVRAEQRPEDKAALIASIDQSDTLFLGDGVNDALAFSAAFCAGTVSVDRPVMPSRAAFFFVGESLNGLSHALALSKRLHQVVQALTWVSVFYNVFAVTAGLLGIITPLRAAIFMPLSSLSLLLFALYSLRERKKTFASALKAVPA